MDNITEKLNTFTSLVMRDAEEKREKLMKRVEKEYSERLDERENELLENAYENIQENIQTAKREANERVLHAQMDSKKQLILRREEIIDEVMKTVRAKLVEFTESDEYEAWLISKIEKALFEVGKGSKIIYISPEDIKLKEKIEQIPDMSKISVEASSERDFLGGAKVLNTDRRVSADYSFKEMLFEQKQTFLQSSGLSLD